MGDLPSAEAKPMENVLFVCKLNPLTKSDDLNIIFSRFGKILSCEVITDKQTGDSLQYAFIEYESKKSCEAAYFKMDNTLIDERRIHVDFSQSVSKLVENWRPNIRNSSKRHGKRDESPTRSSSHELDVRERDTLRAKDSNNYEFDFDLARNRREHGHKLGSDYLNSTRQLDPQNRYPNTN
ncbi:hypothetical protein BN7_1705a [Wickerhamomyces ciferrii]|uniref:peptidylprolyl isomerase n=1 Tax=Wickerhamomyces ciferrii (strain ATCC 14091 / BCRC 22168 / CBS 111 / JCM 3599 / NBRC 0793 / NRRL Y-1031 F-60-10) TaxID=1206466 RepID=K0KAY3_WICCF|nr:uncharacterized protein BN7_1705a [Wickerhamomyces ciferrii]CCH42160.1 hypothetical protein BN7_1705a [Wickerhamomyces ciferrii]